MRLDPKREQRELHFKLGRCDGIEVHSCADAAQAHVVDPALLLQFRHGFASLLYRGSITSVELRLTVHTIYTVG